MDKDLKKIIDESINNTFKSGIPISGEEKYLKQQPGGVFGTSNVDGIMQELQSLDEDAFRIYNDTLCPALWDESLQLDPAARSGLLKVAEDFYEKTGFKAPIIDIYLMGSIANYNWTVDSDADVHVIIDYNQLQIPPETTKEIVKTVASQWNSEHEVTVKGHKVELNIQNVKEQKPHVTGIYSLKSGQWVRQPVHRDVNINKMLVQVKYKEMKKYVEAVIRSGDRDAMKKAKKYIDAFRQYGLDTVGELSVENVVFKALRSKGLLTQLKDSIVQVYDKETSVTESGHGSLIYFTGVVDDKGSVNAIRHDQEKAGKSHRLFGFPNHHGRWRYIPKYNRVDWTDTPDEDKMNAVDGYLAKQSIIPTKHMSYIGGWIYRNLSEVNQKDMRSRHPQSPTYVSNTEIPWNKLTLDNLKALKDKVSRTYAYYKIKKNRENMTPQDTQYLRDELEFLNKINREIERRLMKINKPVAIGNPNASFKKEGYGAGIPETDRLKINNNGSIKRWQIRSKDAPKTPRLK